MHFPKTVLQILITLLLLAGTAYGGTGKGETPDYSMGEVVVTAETIREYIQNHPQDVKVVERKEIVERNLPNVEEILKTMPGVEVYSAPGIGSRISIRGSGKSGGVLVLLNGRPLNSNQFGSQDLNSIPVDSIQSVSVFKPPVPVWLGPGGSEGAINIVTRTPKAMGGEEKSHSSAKAGGGSYGFAEGSLSLPLPLAGGSTLLSATATRRDGKRTNSDRTDGAFSLNWNRDGKGGNRYEINGRYYDAEYGSPGPIDNLTPDARQRYRKGSLDTRYSGMLGETGTLVLTGYGDLVTLDDRSQSGKTFTLDDRKAGVKIDTAMSPDDGSWDLRLGGMAEWNGFEHTLSGEHNRVRTGLSNQFDRRFGPVTATIGLRGDFTSGFGISPGLSAGLGWGVTEKLLLKARGGYTVNVPTFAQLYQTSHGSIDQSRGNPGLKEERVWSSEVGIEYSFGKDCLLQLTLFRADTIDLISSRRGADRIYRPVNINSAMRQGIEFTGKYAWEAGLTVETSLIIQESRNGESGKELPYTPSAKVKATLRYAVPRLKTRLEGTVRYEGRRFSETENIPSQRLADYVVVDLKATHPFSIMGNPADCSIKVENLFDESLQSHFGYPDDGIRFAAALHVRF